MGWNYTILLYVWQWNYYTIIVHLMWMCYIDITDGISICWLCHHVTSLFHHLKLHHVIKLHKLTQYYEITQNVNKANKLNKKVCNAQHQKLSFYGDIVCDQSINSAKFFQINFWKSHKILYCTVIFTCNNAKVMGVWSHCSHSTFTISSLFLFLFITSLRSSFFLFWMSLFSI